MAHEEKDDRAKLYGMIEKVKIAMLTTVEADGSLHTRPMANQESDANGDLWFFAEKGSAVEANVKGNPQVALGFSDPGGSDYVAVSGTAILTDDRATIHDKWNEILTAWFPGGKDDPKIVLIHVNPSKGEFWDTKSGLLYVVTSFLKSKLTGAGPAESLNDNEKVAL